MAALREIAAQFGIKFDTDALKKGDHAINKSIKGLTKLAGVAGLAFGGAALIKGMMALSNEADQLVKTADNLGTTAEKLQAWNHVAGRAGVSSEVMANAFRKVSIVMLQAEQGSKTAVDALSEVGLAVDDLAGKSPEEQLLVVGRALSKIEDVSKRNALASVMLGRRGAAMNKMFKDPALEQALDSYEDLAPVTEEQARNFEVMNDAIGDVMMILKKVAFYLAAKVAPVVSWVALKLTDLWQNSAVFETLAVGVGVLAAVLLSQLAPAIGSVGLAFIKAMLPMLPWIAAAALIGLAVEDLIVMFQGGESVIGEVIDSIFGDGSKDEVLKFFNWLIDDPINILSQFIDDIGYLFDMIPGLVSDAMDEAGKFITRFLNENPLVRMGLDALTFGATSDMFGGGQTVAGSGGGGGTQNTVNGGPTTVNVTTTGDPTAVAAAVGSAIRGENQAQSARMRALRNRP